MNRFSFGSLRVRLILLVLVAIIPSLILILVTGRETRRLSAQIAIHDVTQLAVTASGNQDLLIESTHRLLARLAHLPELHQEDSKACSALFAVLLKEHQQYNNIIAVNPNGELWCSGIPAGGSPNYADRGWFPEVMRTRDFVIGEYVIGRISKKPQSSIAYPIIDAAGNVNKIIVTGFGLDWLNRFVADPKLPPGSVLTVIDRNGTVLARTLEPDKWIGQTVTQAPIVNAIRTQNRGALETTGIDGIKRLYAFAPLGTQASGGVHVFIGIPTSVAYAQADWILTRNLIALGLASLLALIVAWVGGNLFLLRRITVLLHAAKRLEDGDLSARTGIMYGPGELSKLARAFDQMAESLEQRIAERKHAEETILSEHARFVTVMDAIDAVICVADMETHELLFMNAHGRKIWGEHIGEKCWAVIQSGQTGPCAFCTNSKLLDADGKPIGTYVWETQNTINGEWYQCNDQAIRWPDGRLVRLEIATNITQRKRAEEGIRESEKRYRALTDFLPLSIFEVDSAGSLISFNRAALEDFRYSEEDYQAGMNALQFFPPEEWQRLGENMEQIIQGTSIPGQEFTFLRKDGSTFIGLIYAASTIHQNKTVGIRGAIIDITARKRMEEEKRNLEERLQRAEKMEALGKLAGGVAHDLNNVLGVLSGYSELLLREIPEGDRSRGRVEKIFQSTEKGAVIIQDLLTLARRGVTASDVINLNSVVSGFLKTPVFEMIKDYHPQVTFRTECDKNLLNIKGSTVHLEKTVMNLVSNAAESISGKGEVTIRTENRYLDMPVSGYDVVMQGDYVVFTISDTGMGISAEDREKIFEPFYTKKTLGRSGTGLGLTIVWGTVKDHHGYIDVQTEAGKGTTFTLYFPMTREELIAQQQNAPIERYMGNGESVLVVDDIAEQRDVASSLLTHLGYEVHVVSSGEEAVEYLKRDKADILVLDMIMAPGIDGLETYQRVLEINPKQKAILVSGFAEDDRVREAQKAGAGAYVRKPYVMEKIGVAIRDELDGG